MKIERVVGDWFEVNSYVITFNQNQVIIVDAGAKLESILPYVEDREVVALLITHGHFDHVGYLKEYIKHFNVKVFAHENILKTLKDSSLNQSDGWCIKEMLSITLLNGEGEFELGNIKVKYISTPGHCPCSMVYKIENSLFVGDLLFDSGIGRIDMKGGNKEDMIHSLEKVQNLDYKTLYSGHGEASGFERQKRNISAYLRFLKR